MTAQPTEDRKACRRCAGSQVPGYVSVGWTMGICWRCNGSGWEPKPLTKEERKANKQFAAMRKAAFVELDAAVASSPQQEVPTLGALPLSLREAVEEAYAILERDEPERYRRMLESLAAGRGDDVVRALVAYRADWERRSTAL